jgi:hypothetical protein
MLAVAAYGTVDDLDMAEIRPAAQSRPHGSLHARSRQGAFDGQRSDKPDTGSDNLYEPVPGPGQATGRYGETSKSTSLLTEQLELHPQRSRALLGGLVAAALAAVTAKRRTST